MDYLDIKMAVKKYRNCFFLSKKEQGIIEVRRNLMHFLLTLKLNQITTLQIKYTELTSKKF